MSMDGCTDLVSLLRRRAASDGREAGYRFLSDGEQPSAWLSHADLDRAAGVVAARLRMHPAACRHVLLAYPPGLEFLAGFFGCLYAGRIPVPAALPHPRRGGDRLRAIAADCGAALLLTSAAGSRAVRAALLHDPALHELCVLETGLDTQGERVEAPDRAAPDDIAFLQYTSGSTRAPRGVCVGHGNVMANLAAIRAAERTGPHSRGVTWLPAYHDMGLIEGLLAPLHGGYETALLAHGAFLQRPLRWLQAISRLRATVSGGPNFAYDACLRRVRDDDLAGLDLSSWEVAYCGAEPVRATTLRAFAARFGRCGLRASSLRPVYGLAEATLLVSASPADAGSIRVARVSRPALEAGRFAPAAHGHAAQELVSCGRPSAGVDVAIVAAGSLCPLPEGRIGEILVAGPSVANGYHGDVERSAAVYVDATVDGRAARWLRTGDLGCLSQGELYVAGRIKDVVIVRGRKLHPQDIEYGVQRLDPHRIGAVAAFGCDDGAGEGVVVLVEVVGRVSAPEGDAASWQRLADDIRDHVYREHEIALASLAFVAPGALHRTSSGKLQRHRCRTDYAAGVLAAYARFDAPSRAAGAMEAV